MKAKAVEFFFPPLFTRVSLPHHPALSLIFHKKLYHLSPGKGGILLLLFYSILCVCVLFLEAILFPFA